MRKEENTKTRNFRKHEIIENVWMSFLCLLLLFVYSCFGFFVWARPGAI
jgi:hypothetical protein